MFQLLQVYFEMETACDTLDSICYTKWSQTYNPVEACERIPAKLRKRSGGGANASTNHECQLVEVDCGEVQHLKF